MNKTQKYMQNICKQCKIENEVSYTVHILAVFSMLNHSCHQWNCPAIAALLSCYSRAQSRARQGEIE